MTFAALIVLAAIAPARLSAKSDGDLLQGILHVNVFQCESVSAREPIYIYRRQGAAWINVHADAKFLSHSARRMVLSLPIGHYDLRFRSGTCGSLLRFQLLPHSKINASVSLGTYPSFPIDAWNTSLAGSLPNIGITRMTLIRPEDVYHDPKYFAWLNADSYDFEFVRPAKYVLQITLTDGKTISKLVDLSRKSNVHDIMNLSFADIAQELKDK